MSNSSKLTITNSGSFSNGSWISGSFGSFGFTNSTTTTATISASASSGISFIGYNQVVNKVKYIVLGKEVEVEGYTDPIVAIYVSMINLQGKAFYDEVKKQGVSFPEEIEDYLKIALIPWERDKKIDTLL